MTKLVWLFHHVLCIHSTCQLFIENIIIMLIVCILLLITCISSTSLSRGIESEAVVLGEATESSIIWSKMHHYFTMFRKLQGDITSLSDIHCKELSLSFDQTEFIIVLDEYIPCEITKQWMSSPFTPVFSDGFEEGLRNPTKSQMRDLLSDLMDSIRQGAGDNICHSQLYGYEYSPESSDLRIMHLTPSLSISRAFINTMNSFHLTPSESDWLDIAQIPHANLFTCTCSATSGKLECPVEGSLAEYPVYDLYSRLIDNFHYLAGMDESPGVDITFDQCKQVATERGGDVNILSVRLLCCLSFVVFKQAKLWHAERGILLSRLPTPFDILRHIPSMKYILNQYKTGITDPDNITPIQHIHNVCTGTSLELDGTVHDAVLIHAYMDSPLVHFLSGMQEIIHIPVGSARHDTMPLECTCSTNPDYFFECSPIPDTSIGNIPPVIPWAYSRVLPVATHGNSIERGDTGGEEESKQGMDRRHRYSDSDSDRGSPSKRQRNSR